MRGITVFGLFCGVCVGEGFFSCSVPHLDAEEAAEFLGLQQKFRLGAILCHPNVSPFGMEGDGGGRGGLVGLAAVNTTAEEKTVTLDLTIDTEICPVMEYFEIFLGRMILCQRAAGFFGARFCLVTNGLKVM